ncbi:NADH-quinone oxidoreductase subunit C [Methylomicrobium sp. Wu6]|uniref:hydrogenase large subunit n=1 Tax=Methylomicrobium sp. Wu6 TaxID=3107928 RepID=UPI002DD69C35|nr:NADH-quinone oxidoreductase subunit C [Methylomicrobium sp. Wu6]MEC4749016.1 NADH-quinone oxidoreductase subunit C [Methylomicrobium sp. Wu6]
MSDANWTTDFLSRLVAADIAVAQTPLPSATLWQIDAHHWRQFAELAIQQNIRWAAGWAEHDQDRFLINACFEKHGVYLLLRTTVSAAKPALPSQATVYPAANRSERHTRDMFGIDFSGHPDNRPWTRHKAWSKQSHPLRKDFPVQGEPQTMTSPDLDYQFVKAYGAGVYEIPVGPVHAGIIEPGHFRFQADGELILNLEERLGYVHKGIEKIAEGRTPESLARLAGRISGDTTVGHSWAACMAMERAAGVEIPPRAALIREILAERERIANHLGDVGAICNDVAFVFAQMQFTRLRELWLRTNAGVFGHRLLMDRVVPGGVACDVTHEAGQSMLKDIARLRKELSDIVTALDLNTSLEDRLYTAGYLSAEIAEAFGTVGYVGRASGQSFDVRRDAPYPPYDQATFKVPLETEGDIAARVWIRLKEINAALKLIEQFIGRLPIGGDLIAAWRTPAVGSEGLGIVEGWRGEIVAYIRFDGDNQIARFYPRDPSILNWPVFEKLTLNNIVPDFPVCNKSLNGSYSGNDL